MHRFEEHTATPADPQSDRGNLALCVFKMSN